jgi:long-chain acyl-CoA synthetase
MPSQTNFNNLLEIFEASVERLQQRPCLRFVRTGGWTTWDWRTVREKVVSLAGALVSVGVSRGDRVGILSKTRPEWTLADLGIVASGAISVPLHDSATEAQIKQIIQHAGIKAVFVENEALCAKLISIQADLKTPLSIISFEKINLHYSCPLWFLNDFYQQGKNIALSVYEKSLQTLKRNDDLTIVYTSGTTGEPKGVVLTQANFIEEVLAAVKVFAFKPHHVTLVFLPFAHILGRLVQFFHLYTGYVQCFAESLEKIMDNVAAVRPTFMVAVPRILEKMHSRILGAAANLKPWKKKLFFWAVRVGLQAAELRLKKKRAMPLLFIKDQIAKLLVFNKLQHRLGGRFKFFVCGGAPLSVDVGLFFYASGIKILEGYGLTETTAAISVNRHELIKFGTVGPAIGAMQFKIAADGEILVKGPLVFSGYYQDPLATAEAIDSDGWFKTGDIGELDADGYLTITDRKKDIIVTAGGKNIAPQHVENILKADRYISQCLVHGDRRKFLSALVTLDREQIFKYAEEHKIEYRDFSDLVTTPRVHELIQGRIAERNKHLASFETVKKFSILPQEFSIESGDLTVSLKLRRKEIAQKHASVLDSFYEEDQS